MVVSNVAGASTSLLPLYDLGCMQCWTTAIIGVITIKIAFISCARSGDLSYQKHVARIRFNLEMLAESIHDIRELGHAYGEGLHP
jgi:hypothetical protein